MSSSTTPEDTSRRSAEITLARSLLETFLEHGRAITSEPVEHRLSDRPKSSDTDSALTVAERRILCVQNYYNRTAGFLAGAGTLVVVFGGLRWSASRRLLRAGNSHRNAANNTTSTPSPTESFSGSAISQSARQQQQQQQKLYAELEGSRYAGRNPSRSKAISLTPTQPQQQQQQLLSSSDGILSEDVVAQIQFMCVGAFAIVLSSVVARLAWNEEQFFQELGELPLQPGSSRLVHAVCPAILEQFQAKVHKSEEGDEGYGMDDSSENDTWQLAADPTTIELESMLHLVSNCRTRMVYERAHGGTPENPADVPEGGVPPRYVNIRNEDEENTIVNPSVIPVVNRTQAKSSDWRWFG